MEIPNKYCKKHKSKSKKRTYLMKDPIAMLIEKRSEYLDIYCGECDQPVHSMSPKNWIEIVCKFKNADVTFASYIKR